MFVVCDAGGGTVVCMVVQAADSPATDKRQDIISYEVMNTNPLEFGECVEGKGKMCGAIFVDEAFESVMKIRLGSKWDKMSITSRKSLINTEWEHGIKRQFDNEEQDWTVTIAPEAFDSRRPRWKRFDDKDKDVPLEQGHLRFKR